MLGWLHQSIASEKELLNSLLRRTDSEGKAPHSETECFNRDNSAYGLFNIFNSSINLQALLQCQDKDT